MRENETAVRAPLRWAGSKRKSLPTLKRWLPGRVERYVEPFAGSACLAFSMQAGSIVLGDINTRLIEFYDFLRPVEYIRFAVEASHTEWLPIFYFAQQSQLDRADLATFIGGLGGTAKRREMFTNRATGAKMALTVPVGTPAAMLMQIVAGDFPEPTNGRDATNVAMAICGLISLPNVERVTILALLERCHDLAQAEGKSGALSTIRRAACRIDELLFAPSS